VNVTVLDENEPPSLADKELEVAENSPTATIMPPALQATDQDSIGKTNALW